MKRFALRVMTVGLLSAIVPANAAVVVQTSVDVAHGDIFASDSGLVSLSADRPAAATNAVDALGDTIATYAAMLPEPSEWVLLVAGFGIIGYAMRSRKRAHVSFN